MKEKISLIRETEALIDYINSTHRYSTSRIYGIWNEVFGANEKPQTCSSCLIRKVKELKNWMENEKKEQETQYTETEQAKPTAEPTQKTSVKKGRKKKQNKDENL